MNSERTWIKKVKQRMEMLNINVEHLARLMRMTPGGVRHYMNGTRAPSLEIFFQLMSVLDLQDTSVNEILGEEEGASLSEYPLPMVANCPILSEKDAINWPENKSQVLGDKCFEPLGVKLILAPNCYALQVKVDTMQASVGKHSFPKGSYIIIDPQKQHENNSFVVAKKEGSEQLIFRQYVKDDLDNEFLSIINENYKNRSINLEKNIKICGVVVAHLDVI